MIKQLVLTTVLSQATRCDLIPDPNHCPCATSLECEEGGITLVKCFVLLWSCIVRKLDTSSWMAGLVARSCFIGGNYLFTEFPLLFKNEPRWDGEQGTVGLVPGRISLALRGKSLHTF